MVLYNFRELGHIRNISMQEQNAFCCVPIYQILPVKYLIKIFRNNTLRFNNIVKSWEDPYELFMLKHKITIEDCPLYDTQSSLQKNYYGQCWSLNKDSDAMWRIYSPDKESVRIKTSVIKMIEVLNQTRGMMWIAPIFGKVKYLTQEKITEWLLSTQTEENPWIFDCFSESLFIKRHEFEHENEIRFLIHNGNLGKSPKPSNVHDDYIDMQVDPSNFIEEIALDPRLSDKDFEDRKILLSSITGSVPICKSDLYSFQPIELSYKKSVLEARIPLNI